MRLIIILLISISISSNLFAFDPEQSVAKCGKHIANAKLNCPSSDICELIIAEGKLSELRIKLRKSELNLTYFDQMHITMNIQMIKRGKDPIAKPLTPPIQQVRAIKKSGINLLEVKQCSI